MRSAFAALLCGLIGSGCAGTVQLTPRAEQVHLLSAPPADLLTTYSELGVVSCSRDRGLWLFGRSVEDNILHCQNELRNEAAAMDADLVVVTSQQLGKGGCGACVTLVGTAYQRRRS